MNLRSNLLAGSQLPTENGDLCHGCLEIMSATFELVLDMSVFQSCGCTPNHLYRVERRPWMRLLPWRRLYQCANCKKLQLRSEDEVTRAQVEFASRSLQKNAPRQAKPG